MTYRVQRGLELEEQDVRGPDTVVGPRDVVNAQEAVRTRGNGDRVLGLLIHHDERDTRRGSVVPRDELGSDALGGQAGEGGVAEGFGADSGHERDVGPKPGRRYRLVGALPAGGHEKGPAQHRFPRSRNGACLDDEVGVGTPDDDDARGPAHGRSTEYRSSFHAGMSISQQMVAFGSRAVMWLQTASLRSSAAMPSASTTVIPRVSSLWVSTSV